MKNNSKLKKTSFNLILFLFLLVITSFASFFILTYFYNQKSVILLWLKVIILFLFFICVSIFSYILNSYVALKKDSIKTFEKVKVIPCPEPFDLEEKKCINVRSANKILSLAKRKNKNILKYKKNNNEVIYYVPEKDDVYLFKKRAWFYILWIKYKKTVFLYCFFIFNL